MPNYRRMRRCGGTFFLTLVTEHRAPLSGAESAPRCCDGPSRTAGGFIPFPLKERYRAEWCCRCEGEAFEEPPEFQAIAPLAGE